MKQDPPPFPHGAATDEPASSPNPRARHDGFDAERKLLFLTALRQGASVLDACALVGISNRTAYNHRRRDPAFAGAWRLARGAHTLPLELVAWKRAVEGVEEQMYRHGKPSHVRTRYSDSLLRLLLAGEQPGKYGRRAALMPDLEWLTKMVAGCIAGKTAPLQAALAAALDEIAALKARLEAPPGQIVNFMNPPVTRPRAADHAARRGARRPSRPANGLRKAAPATRNSPIHASAVNFADQLPPQSGLGRGTTNSGGGGMEGEACQRALHRVPRAPPPHRPDGEDDHTLCTEPTFDTGAGQVYRRRHE